MGLEHELGLDGPDVSPERKAKVLRIFNKIQKLIANNHEDMLKMVKLSLMNEEERSKYRQQLAESGVEFTPNELKSTIFMIKLALKHM